jgi:hypothetical protein
MTHLFPVSLDTFLLPATLRQLIADDREASENATHDFYRRSVHHNGFSIEDPPSQWPRILVYQPQMPEESLFHSLANKLRSNDLPQKISFSSQAVFSVQAALTKLIQCQLISLDSVQILLHTICLSSVRSGEVGGASFLNLPGLVWMRPGINWSPDVYGESLFHELIHQAVNLYDGVIGLISDLGYREQVELPSAIRRIYPSGQKGLRPFWGAFHAALVAWWLVSFFKEVDNDEKAEIFSVSLHESLPALLTKPKLLTQLGSELLTEMMDRLVID